MVRAVVAPPQPKKEEVVAKKSVFERLYSKVAVATATSENLVDDNNSNIMNLEHKSQQL